MIQNKNKKYNILGIITARGGSKGIPGKNIKPLLGKPLIAHTIDTAKRSKLITKLIVSTDSKKIIEVAKKYGADAPFIRPNKLSRDNTPTLPVVRHALNFMENKFRINFDYVVVLQPTSPIRLTSDIDGPIDMLINSRADSAVTVFKIPGNQHPVKAKTINKNKLIPFCFSETEKMLTRQNLKDVYKRTGAVYVSARDTIVRQKSIFGENCLGYIVPEERYADIDTEYDWVLAEYKLKTIYNKQKK